MFILGVTFVVLDGTTLYLYARCAEQMREWLVHGNGLRWQRRLTGTLPLAGAGLLAVVQR